MRRLMLFLVTVCFVALSAAALAGDFHVAQTLTCYDCHTAHYSQTHAYSADVAGSNLILIPPMAAGTGPFNNLLRKEPNELCLTCHNSNNWAPDVFGAGTGSAVRQAGGLNALAGHLANDAGYDEDDGHTLWSTATAPGGTFAGAAPEGLMCVSCHAQHGSSTQYRNLLNRGIFTGKNLTYNRNADNTVVVPIDFTKDVYQRAPLNYAHSSVDFLEVSQTASPYGAWCQSCHTNFHGAGGSANMGGVSQGWSNPDPAARVPWLRHPTADVNIGSAGGTFISSLAQFNTHTNRVKVLDQTGTWNATSTTVTPSCMSCHKGHGNKNSFGLIWMGGVGNVTEEGDDAATLADGAKYIALCRQCHTQASGYAAGFP